MGTCVLYPLSLSLSPSFGCLNFLLLLQHAHFGFKHNFITSLSVLYHIKFPPTIYLFLFFSLSSFSCLFIVFIYSSYWYVSFFVTLLQKALFHFPVEKMSDNKDHLQVLIYLFFLEIVYIFHSKDINNS